MLPYFAFCSGRQLTLPLLGVELDDPDDEPDDELELSPLGDEYTVVSRAYVDVPGATRPHPTASNPRTQHALTIPMRDTNTRDLATRTPIVCRLRMRWCLALLVLAACDAKAAAPENAPEPRVVRPVRAAPARRHVPRTETRPPTPTRSLADAWRMAESTTEAEDWDAAADAYLDALAPCTQDCLELAYGAVLARRNALAAAPEDPPPGDDPAPVPPRVQATIDALDTYVDLAEPGDPDLPSMKFLAGNALYRYRQPDAIARLEAVLREFPRDDVAEYAANTLLDLLMRSGRTDELRVWVERLLADASFLAGRDDLRDTLERVHAAIAG